MKRPVSSRLVILFFAAAVAILIGVMALTFVTTVDLIAVDRLYVARSGVLISLEEVKSTMLTAVIAERNYVLTGDEKDLAPYTQAKADIWASVDTIGASFADTPARHQQMPRFFPEERHRMRGTDA